MSVPLECIPQPSRELVQLLRDTLANRPLDFVSNWPALLQQATWHGVDAFLYPTLARQPEAQQPPSEVMARWRLQSLAAAAAAVRREAQIRELLAALSGANVCVVPLKGTWLASHIYPESDQRAMSDIDLLVPIPDLSRAQETLVKLGYTPHCNTASIKLDADQTYTCPRHAWPLELHWQLGIATQPPLHQPNVPGLWQRLVPQTLLGVPIHALCPEEHLIFLAYHILHHRLQLPLRGYLDLALLSRSADSLVNRERLNKIATEWRMEHALPRMLAIAYDLFDQSPPPELTDMLSDEEQPHREQAIQTILTSSAQRALQAEPTLLTFQQRRPLARIGLIFQRIFMSREFLRRHYACARWRIGLPLAYFLRTRDLLRRNAKAIRQTLQHDPGLTRQLELAAAREQLLHWALSGRKS